MIFRERVFWDVLCACGPVRCSCFGEFGYILRSIHDLTLVLPLLDILTGFDLLQEPGRDQWGYLSLGFGMSGRPAPVSPRFIYTQTSVKVEPW